jgi:hypothetical protein
MPSITIERPCHEILEQEVRLARSVAVATRPHRPFSVWEVLIPFVFILGYMRSRQQREMFVQNFIFTKKMALEAARDMCLDVLSYHQVLGRIEAKTKILLETLEPGIYAEAIRQAQLEEIRLLIPHYQRLFRTEMRRYADCITAAYPTHKDYLSFLDRLHRAEKNVAAAAVEIMGNGANLDMVKRIERCSHQLRLKKADRFYSNEELSFQI